MDVLGGALEFKMLLSTSDFDTALEKMSANLKQQIDTIIATSKSSETALVRMFQLIGQQTVPESIQKTIDKIVELQDEEDRLNEIISKTAEGADLEAYKKQLADVQKILEQLPKDLQQQVETQLLSGLEKLTQGLENTSSQAASAVSQLRKILQEITTVSPEDPRYDQLIKQAAELKEQIKGVNQEIKLSTSNAPGLVAMRDGLRGLVGGFEALSGAMVLLGGSSEQVEKATRNVIAAMGILNGIQEVSNLLEKNSALNKFLTATFTRQAAIATGAQAAATVGLAGAEGVQAVATEGATVAQWSLNAAMAANPAGAILIAITAVVAAIQIFSSTTEDSTETQTAHNKALAEAEAIYRELVELYNQGNRSQTLAAENAVTIAQAQGKSEKEILALREKAVKARQVEQIYILASLGISAHNRSLGAAELQVLSDELTVYKEQLATAIKLDSLSEKDLALLQSKVALLQGNFSAAKSAFDALSGSDLEERKIREEGIKKGHEDQKKSDVAAAEARLILVKKNTQEELALQIDAIHARTKAELDDVNLTTGERQKIIAQEGRDIQEAQRKYKVLQFSNEQELLKARLANAVEGSREELDLKLGIINQAAATELLQEGITSEKRIRIRAEERKQVSELFKKYDQDQINSEVNTVTSNINARLAAVKAGTEAELDLKRDLIRQKEIGDINSANFTIKNEIQLQAKIKEIQAKAFADQKKLNEEFRQKFIDETFRDLEATTRERNISLNAVLGDPTATNRDKSAAEAATLENQKAEIFTKILYINRAITKDADNNNKLLEQRRGLFTQLLELINRINNANKKKQLDNLDDVARKIGDIAGGLRGLATAVSPLNAKLGESIGLLADIGGGIKNVVADFKKFDLASKKDANGKTDVAGQVSAGLGIVGTVVSVISTVANIFKKAKEERIRQQKEIEGFNTGVLVGEQEINLLYQERERSQVRLNKLKLEGIKAEEELLKKQAAEIQKNFNSLFEALKTTTVKVLGKDIGGIGKALSESITQSMLDAGYTLEQIRQKFASSKDILLDVKFTGLTYEQLKELFFKGQLEGKAKDIFLELQKLEKAGLDVKKMMEDLKRESDEVVTGTTFDSLLDSITSGFKDGLKNAKDFAATFEDLMKNAVLNALKFQILQGPLTEFFNEFAGFAKSGDVLTADEVRLLKERFGSVMDDAGKKFEELKKITGINFGTGAGAGNNLTTAIKGITEQQADLLAGQFGGQRIATLTLVDLQKIAITHLNSIEINTANAVDRIEKQSAMIENYFGTRGVKIA